MPDTAKTDFNVTTGDIPGSKKIYVRSENRDEVRVPMREQPGGRRIGIMNGPTRLPAGGGHRRRWRGNVEGAGTSIKTGEV